MKKTLLLILGMGLSSASAMAQSDASLEKIRFICETPEREVALRALTAEVIQTSLVRFDVINPEIADRIRVRLQVRKLDLECGGSELLDEDVVAESKGRLFKPYRIRLGLDPHHAMGSMDHKNTLLHELLHYAKVDNMPTRIHNDVSDSVRLAQDAVYACAEVVYPVGYIAAEAAISTCSSAHR